MSAQQKWLGFAILWFFKACQIEIIIYSCHWSPCSRQGSDGGNGDGNGEGDGGDNGGGDDAYDDDERGANTC